MQNAVWPLVGSLVTLRPFTEVDITQDYIAWLNDPELMKFSNQRFRHHSVASSREYLASFNGSDNLFFAIIHDEQLVGTMTAYVSKIHQTADIGLLIGSQFQGNGFAKDAWILLVNYLLRSGIRKVTGGTLRCNKAMLRIMERGGMQQDGVRKAQELVNGRPEDILYFARFNYQCTLS